MTRMYKAITILCLVSMMVTTGCIFAEGASNSKDVQSGDMTSTSDMDTRDMVNPSDATADVTDPADMAPDLDPPNGLFVFLTSIKYPLFNGLADADKACNTDSNKPNTGTYKAMLGHSKRRPCYGAECVQKPEGVNWVFQPNQLYQQYDAVNDVEDVFTTNDKAKFLTLSNQIKPIKRNFATGFERDWQVSPKELDSEKCMNGCRTTCHDWTLSIPMRKEMAVGWTSAQVVGGFLAGGFAYCGEHYILCVEQPPEPTDD